MTGRPIRQSWTLFGATWRSATSQRPPCAPTRSLVPLLTAMPTAFLGVSGGGQDRHPWLFARYRRARRRRPKRRNRHGIVAARGPRLPLSSGCPDENPDRKRGNGNETRRPDQCAHDRNAKVEDWDVDQPRDNG